MKSFIEFQKKPKKVSKWFPNSTKNKQTSRKLAETFILLIDKLHPTFIKLLKLKLIINSLWKSHFRFLRSQKSYDPERAVVLETIDKIVEEIGGAENFKEKKFNLLTRCEAAFSHSVPNSQLFEIRTLGRFHVFQRFSCILYFSLVFLFYYRGCYRILHNTSG